MCTLTWQKFNPVKDGCDGPPLMLVKSCCGEVVTDRTSIPDPATWSRSPLAKVAATHSGTDWAGSEGTSAATNAATMDPRTRFDRIIEIVKSKN